RQPHRHRHRKRRCRPVLEINVLPPFRQLAGGVLAGFGLGGGVGGLFGGEVGFPGVAAAFDVVVVEDVFVVGAGDAVGHAGGAGEVVVFGFFEDVEDGVHDAGVHGVGGVAVCFDADGECVGAEHEPSLVLLHAVEPVVAV